jgi:prevent-host-death family protein
LTDARREEHAVSTVPLRDLSRNASKVINEVQRTGRPAIVTRNGEPVVVLYAIDPEHLEDYLLATAPEFVRDIAAADAEASAGTLRTLEDVLGALDDADATEG